MKNLSILILLFAISILSSCGPSSVDDYAKKCAEIKCKSNKLVVSKGMLALAGDKTAIAEIQKLAGEEYLLMQEMQVKYKNQDDLQKFQDAYLKALSECK